MNIYSLENIDLNQFEYCFLTETSKYNTSIFPINIPKIMPLIPLSIPKTINNILSMNIFINDSDSKPKISNSIQTQNYLSVPRFKNTNFNYKAIDDYIPKNEKFICCVMDKNIKDIYLTDNI